MLPSLPIVDSPADPSRRTSPRSEWGPKLERLRASFEPGVPWVVAFSGGVDSALVLAVAAERLGPSLLALTAVSETLPEAERRYCVDFAAARGIQHALVDSDEMAVEDFVSNPTDRCYHCKSELYRVARAEARRRGFARIADGVNTDDLGDHRPGLIAAREADIVHPLVDAGMSKADVRGAARHLGLDTWDKPAFACLSSRFPYGTRITPERLGMVGDVEDTLRHLGFRQVRVRYHDDVVRIEVDPSAIARLVEPGIRDAVVAAAKAAGFRYVTVDLQGYRMGSLNERLPS